MVLIIRVALMAVIALAVNIPGCHASTPMSPRFKDYPTTIEAVDKPHEVVISDAQSRRYRTQLREASRHAPDFAGHYILATWGCGASCVMAAAIDAKTGVVTSLPFTVSNWPLNVTEPLEFKASSRLLVIRGSRNEKGGVTSYYEFTGNRFKLIGEISTEP